MVWERKVADPGDRRDAHARAAGRSRPRDRRQRRRRVRHPRLDRRHRPQHRQAGLAHLHHPGRRRARQRDLEGRQGALEARRRLGLGDRHLRSRNRHVLPGHRQCRPRLGSRIPARRQQVGGERARAQPDRRQDQVGLPVHPERSLRLRRDLRAPDHQRQGQRRGPQARGACRAQRLLLRARPHQRLVRHRQAIRRPAELDDRPRSQDRPAAQLQSQHRRPGIRAGQPRLARQAARASGCARRTSAARTGSPAPTIPSSICSTFPRSRAATPSRPSSRRTSSTRAARSSRASGSPAAAARPTERLYGSLKALDPATGETKARLKLEYPNYSGALATAGNLVFLGHYDGTFTAHDAKTLQEVWSFNVGTGINAPPITYSVNGKQYVAVLVGSRQALNRLAARARAQEHGDGVHAVRVRAAVSRSHRHASPARRLAPAFRPMRAMKTA